ncbi:MAG: hypothetical protein H6912_07630 [Kordiimonadaceae bacterium]|nr:hypothetical protein [Kordiimonadaceae bacterium]
MTKSIYVITGVLALTFTGVAMSQEEGRGMSMMDTNKNGTVEKSEFSAMLEKRFTETDKNGGGITLDEYKAKANADREAMMAKRKEMAEDRKEEREKRAEERLQKRFESMDADKNGTVSAEEYKAAGEKMFDRMDRNGDGILNDRRGRGDRMRDKPRAMRN